MTSSQETNDELAKDLAKSLQVTSTLMQSLLTEIKENSTSLAVFREKLESMRDNVDTLSNIVRRGNGKGSLVTRLALAEQSLETLEEAMEEYHAELSNIGKAEKDFKREKSLSKLKVAAVAIPGFVSLIIIIIKLIMGEGAE